MSSKIEGESQEAPEERIVSGGATAFPRLDPRPEYPPASKIFRQALVRSIRGPLLAVLAAKYIVGPIHAYLARKLVRERCLPESLFYASATTIAHLGTYFIVNGFFGACDAFELLQQFKLFRKPSIIPSNERILEAIKQFLLGIPPGFFALIGLYPALLKKGAPSILDPVPSSSTLFRDFLVAYHINMWGFYFAHRLVHSRKLYRLIHKQHHTFVGTVGFATEYATETEQALANLLPTLSGCILMNAHPVTWLTWLIWRLEETYEAHSGYCFADTFLYKIGLTNAESAAYHDHHHVENKGNFGYELTDWLFGTMDHWVAQGEMEGYVQRARDAYKEKLAKQGKTV